MTDGMKTLGEKLRTLCAARRMKTIDLAREFPDIPKSTIYNWCNDVYIPDVKSALRLAGYFGVPLDYLADDARDDPSPSPHACAADEDTQYLLTVIADMRISPRLIARWILRAGAGALTSDPSALPRGVVMPILEIDASERSSSGEIRTGKIKPPDPPRKD